jgi:L-methionine (R)-S-oxide reductase
MGEELIFQAYTKKARYKELLPQVFALLENEHDAIALMANTSAALAEAFDFLWVGFYRVSNDQLILGPFQGPIACTRIPFGKGVCGNCWQLAKTVVVPNVDEFPGHIACSSHSKSEIVVPLISKGTVVAVLDIDSSELSTFDETDVQYLEELCAWLSDRF